MKLFQRLLIAPAALGLLAPLAANANIVEQKGEELSAGAFASATKLTGRSVFTNGWIDAAANNDNKLTTEYNYTIDLNSSFTGSDNLHAGLEAGNQGELVTDSQVNVGNELEVASLYYEFPIGDFAVTAGPLLDQDDVISAKTSIYSETFRLDSLPWGNSGETGAGVAVAYYADNGFNGSFSLLSENGSAEDATRGAFTQEGNDQYTASLGYDAANYGGGIIYTARDQIRVDNTDTKDTSLAAGVYFRPENFPTISLNVDKLDNEDGVNSSDFMVGLDYGVGDGTLSAAWQSSDRVGVDTTNYEVYYSYPINDGVSVSGGLFSEEVNGADNTEGFIVETFFNF